MTAYRELNGLLLPTKGRATFKLPSGDFDYIDVEVTELEYDKP